MKQALKVAVVSVLALSGIASVACSSADTTSGNLAKACNISGTYKVHQTPQAGAAATCGAVADSTVTLNSSGDAGAATPGCTNTQDTSTCTASTTCKIATSGFTTNVSATVKFAADGSSGSGSISSKTTKDADGSVLSDCTYDITYTRQ